jgi:cytochrome c oxidase cbb3-type subunit 3
MFRLDTRAIRAGFALLLTAGVWAQDEPAMAPPRASPRRGPRGAQSTREFLGLGPAPDAAAAAKGEPVYKQNCGTCHGQNARGSQGPSLVRSVSVLHDEKGEEIGPIIKNGRPQAGMPAFPSLSANDVYNISQYLHLQVELAANRGTYNTTYGDLRAQTTGVAKNGEAFFQGAGGCSKCHSVTGDLAGIGTKFPQAALLQARFLWPARQGATKAKITLPTGKVVEGSLQTLNDFDVSFHDSAGQYHYYRRDQVKVEVEDNLGPHRALLPRYTDANIHDLAAYLVTLK